MSSDSQPLLRALPGFSAGYYLREQSSGRLMSPTAWDSEELLEAAVEAVGERPAGDQRGIDPSRVARTGQFSGSPSD
jgi:hypothetical protein